MNDDNDSGRSRRRFLSASGAALLTLTLKPGTAAAAVGKQFDWEICGKCYQLFYNGYPSKGRCPLGFGHTSSSIFNYYLEYSSTREQEVPGYRRQYDWRFCEKCYTLFYDGYTPKGLCAAGGEHRAQGFMFGLWDVRTPLFETVRQTNWRFCWNCHVLFYAGYPPNLACPTGGAHLAQGWDFFLLWLPGG